MSTAGKRSRRVATERTEMSMSDFQAEIFKLGKDSESKNIMVFARPNAGKTVLAGTTPGRNFWLVGEPGYKTAARVAGAVGHGRRITSTTAALAAIDWLNYKKRYRKFNFLIVDGLSWMIERWRFAYAAEAFDIDPTKRQHRNMPTEGDYFNTQNFTKHFISQLVDMPVNLLVTAHAWKTTTAEVDTYIFPGIQGKDMEVAQTVVGLMDATGYLQVRQKKTKRGKPEQYRRIWWDQSVKPEVQFLVGDKFNCLGSYMDNPTMPDILTKIDGGETDGEEEDD